MPLRAKLTSYERTIASTNTPESAASTPGESELTTDAVIQAKNDNNSICKIGDEAGGQFFELLPGAVIALSDLFHLGDELEYDLDEIFVDVGNNGDGINVLKTKPITG